MVKNKSLRVRFSGLRKNRGKNAKKVGVRFFEALVYILPVVVYFSYYPVISLGANETMNFELSLPLIWLVVFNVFSLAILIKRRLFKILFETKGLKWLTLLFPIYATATVIWSLNTTRGILTAGVLWLVYFAVIFLIFLTPRVVENPKFKENFLKWFFAAAILMCGWCVLQCILDLAGVSKDATLLCGGCVYGAFGFPHPNGFAIEPQFMGNLLLAPTIVSLYNLRRPLMVLVSVALSTTLFLTFSRGAIYAFVVALVFLTAFRIAREKSARALIVWPVVILSFVVALSVQGLMAQVSPTDDTYQTGVAKALNHLTLGVVDIRNETSVRDLETDETAENETSVRDLTGENDKKASFSGYVEESTTTRVELTKAAVEVWAESPKNIMFGVGLGGAGQALYEAGKTATPKEIVQNEYASLLLETGIVGVVLAAVALGIIVFAVLKRPGLGREIILTLFVAYGITLCFFAGMTNALQIYLLPAAFMAVFKTRTTKTESREVKKRGRQRAENRSDEKSRG